MLIAVYFSLRNIIVFSPHYKNVEITTEDLMNAISQVRPLNEAWRKRYEKWSINTGLLRKTIESTDYNEIPNGTTPLITFTPCRPLSADNNDNQSVNYGVSRTLLSNFNSRSDWKKTL